MSFRFRVGETTFFGHDNIGILAAIYVTSHSVSAVTHVVNILLNVVIIAIIPSLSSFILSLLSSILSLSSSISPRHVTSFFKNRPLHCVLLSTILHIDCCWFHCWVRASDNTFGFKFKFTRWYCVYWYGADVDLVFSWCNVLGVLTIMGDFVT